jgi:predicted site-specific integrase-resolvase
MNGSSDGSKSVYIKPKQANKVAGVTNQTLRRWAQENKIGFVKDEKGRYSYNKKDILSLTDRNLFDPFEKKEIGERKKYTYCRVSSRKQLDDLERQKNKIKYLYPEHTLVEDISSGLNFKRKGLQRILLDVFNGNVEEIVVSHKDRLCRFGFELIEFICSNFNTRLKVLDYQNKKTEEQELSDDIISIIQIFACKKMGRRRYKNEEDKTEITEEQQKESDQ